MDLVSILRTLGGLGTVLGILSGALWLVRRYDIRLPGRTGMLRVTRLELVERLPLDARRSVALLRRDGREHLILIAPEGHLILESGVIRDAADAVAEGAASQALPREIPQFRAELAAASESFGTLVEQACKRTAPFGRALGSIIARAVAFAASARPVAHDPPQTRLQRTSTRRVIERARKRAIRLARVLRHAIDRAAPFVASIHRTVKDPPASPWTGRKRPSLRNGIEQVREWAAPFLATLRLSIAAFAATARRISHDPPTLSWTGLKRASFRKWAEQARERAALLGRALRRLIDRAAALVMPPTFAAPASPIFHAPPIPLRTGIKRKPNRKAVRKAHAARKGLRHA